MRAGKEHIELGIHEVSIDYHDSAHTRVNSVWVRFGDGHELEVLHGDCGACVRLVSEPMVCRLNASKPLCDYERALNLLSLYFPSCRED